MKAIARLFAAGALTLSSIALAESPHFGYSGDNGPDNWSKLSPEFAACQAGKRQSPVNLTGAQDVALPDLDLDYSTLALDFVNNGHAVQANYAAGSTLADSYHENAPNRAHVRYEPGSTMGHLGSTFELKQFHFHSPSEHQVDGKNMLAEVHFVHADANGNLAVVGVFVAEGAAHRTISRLWEVLPGAEGESNVVAEPTSASDLLPSSKEYDYYEGSLTTPPCSEGVRWLVMKQAITMSGEQIAALRQAIGFDNNRPVQNLNGRVIFE